ncbi:hypothetical protein HBI38_224630 [Parastagonospora nodorum]|nr:hypothetical protein HBI78_161110 [Parastagonospora nodorum]KAH5197722.1 hypothetical protein HBH77_136040 [Parastagonospora nodorum]KAH6020755.1 hypothetical protein HBI83_107020 [Parastagonospora nodorum]KAH6131255.1 hypothetical protein HBI64_092940 [Parastagonospora nodorum]KAH6269169.1 hypothetical protein HBI41_094170 [Parastagonospora nodorum]
MENGRPPGQTGHANILTPGAGSTDRWGIIPMGWNSTENGEEIHTHREEHGKYQLGFTGTMDMKAVIPPRYPCTSNLTCDTTLQVIPGLGQKNLMPDALVKTNITFKQHWSPKKKYTMNLHNMIGFHDQMWSSKEYNNTQRHQRHIPPLYVYHETGDTHGKVLNEGCGQEPGLLDVHSDKKVTKITIKINADTNLEMQIGKDFANIDTYRVRWTGHVKAVLKGGNKDVDLIGTAWFEEGDFSKENPLPKPNLPERVYVERDSKVQARDMI